MKKVFSASKKFVGLHVLENEECLDERKSEERGLAQEKQTEWNEKERVKIWERREGKGRKKVR